MIETLLIANRGEIACRIIRTAKKLGIRTIAVYSSADRHSLHVTMADQSCWIGEAPSRASYLNQEKLIEVALKYHAQAIHPGYGFLSENAQFAQRCQENKLIFIGPPASAIESMGSKSAAKALAQAAGVPLIPGYHGAAQDDDSFIMEAKKIGYPILIKAAMGGGGKGMRVVEHEGLLLENLAAARREAMAGFGDATLLLEKYLAAPRHIEIQIFTDQQGNGVYLFERDCSIQRRHQKVVEEAPAINFSEELRQKMGEASLALAKQIHYVGAGTMEFLLDQNQFYFMEMNTRLQVEHPVTEMITGLDLVEWQIRIAEGEVLPLAQEQLHISGHAIEVRICAENPDEQFLPSTGTLHYLTTPKTSEFVRVESGIREHDAISSYYDSMIAKLIVWGRTRSEAVARLQQQLDHFYLAGLHSNLEFLGRIVRCSAYQQGELNTSFITSHAADLQAKQDVPLPVQAALAYLRIQTNQSQSVYQHNRALIGQSWYQADGWRMNARALQKSVFMQRKNHAEIPIHYEVENIQPNCRFRLIKADDGANESGQNDFLIEASNCQDRVFLSINDQEQINLNVYVQQDFYFVFYQGRTFSFEALNEHYYLEHEHHENQGNLNAPMPGAVIAVPVKAGQTVAKGQTLMVLEAMKMEHAIIAPEPGQVAEVFFKVGDVVAEGVELVRFEVSASA